ncbi:hypothetical protein CCR75_004959 [Bremia lactucae]|uniref:Coilin N-terminal domain-containing protein n=1 Tax=Bremia lactucae TaxID=4779 RepID=A0A976FEN3_BRELC|nr:hypothetical protein CCR75_004959 [Bremia lactucae]
MDVRVRLVFADEVGRHLQRRCGFTSCWYLIPSDLKLVGDLSLTVLREFELRKRCPNGLELRLENSPLLATQSIRIVRDSDTISIHCPLCEHDKTRAACFSKCGVKTSRKQKKTEGVKRKSKHRQQRNVLAKVVDSNCMNFGESREVATVKGMRVPRSSSSSDSDSSSGCSSESTNSNGCSSKSTSRNFIKEDAPIQHDLNHSQAVRQARHTESVDLTSQSVVRKLEEPKKNKKKTRRRRQRLQQRNAGRVRNSKQENKGDAANQMSRHQSAFLRQEAVATSSNQATEEVLQRGNNFANPRGYPRAKAHILFDEDTGDQVVKHNESEWDARNYTWVSRKLPASELAKYGPASSDNTQRDLSDSIHHTASSNDISERDEDVTYSTIGRKRKEYGNYEERWKRSYEIVASVQDKAPEDSRYSDSKLTKALALYPNIPVASPRFAIKDIIAFKTLTLCLETCQPVLSEWKCGQIQAMDAPCGTIELSNWDVAYKDNTVDFCKSPCGELYSIQTIEIAELRILSGPSCTALQSDSQDKELEIVALTKA